MIIEWVWDASITISTDPSTRMWQIDGSLIGKFASQDIKRFRKIVLNCFFELSANFFVRIETTVGRSGFHLIINHHRSSLEKINSSEFIVHMVWIELDIWSPGSSVDLLFLMSSIDTSFRYLIEQRGFEPDQAMRGNSIGTQRSEQNDRWVMILAFQEARGYPIEKYLDDLKRRIPTVYVSINNHWLTVVSLCSVSLLDEPFSSSSEDADEEEKQDENDRPLPSTRPSSA